VILAGHYAINLECNPVTVKPPCGAVAVKLKDSAVRGGSRGIALAERSR